MKCNYFIILLRQCVDGLSHLYLFPPVLSKTRVKCKRGSYFTLALEIESVYLYVQTLFLLTIHVNEPVLMACLFTYSILF